jgi:hypothetical protein
MRPRLGIAILAATVLALAVPAASPAATTHWLCKPGLAHNPCTPGLSTTVYSPTSKLIKTETPKATTKPAADCFYVYPTVSDQKTTLANFNADPEIKSIALYQAARFSQRCRVYAPLYRQVTIQTLDTTGGESPAQLATGINDVRSAFADYLKHYNHGRPFVLIGHSQGSFVLQQLIAKDVDTKPAVRKLLLSAMLLGGNTTVKTGQKVGGNFKHIPTCQTKSQLACLIAFSTFDTPVLPDSKFGRAAAGRDVVCTNPALLTGNASDTLQTIFPSAPFAPGSTIALGIQLVGLTLPHPKTTWVSFPTSYTAKCSSANGAHVLQITPKPGAQTPKPSPDGTWGLHLADVNIALGNLVNLVGTQAAAFARRAA